MPQGLMLEEDEPIEVGTKEWYMYVGIVLFCILSAGLASGLTVGLLSIDMLELELKERGENEQDKKAAQALKPLIEKHHWLLVTLLVTNACAAECMPLFLDKLVSPVIAILISVTAVLIFGEIIPQAICVGPKQLQIAHCLAPVVKVLMYLTFIVSYPIAKLLDCLFQHEENRRFNDEELYNLVGLHAEEDTDEEEKLKSQPSKSHKSNHASQSIHAPLLSDMQKNVIQGAIKGVKMQVNECKTDLKEVTSVLYDEVVDEAFIKRVKQSGFSRLPVFYDDSKQVMIGCLLVKTLAGVDVDLNYTVQQMLETEMCMVRKLLIVEPTANVESIISLFMKGQTHMACICEGAYELQKMHDEIWETLSANQTLNRKTEAYTQQFIDSETIKKFKILGIATLEDCLEKVFKFDIQDEMDVEKEQKLVAKQDKSINQMSSKKISLIQSIKIKDSLMHQTKEGVYKQPIKNYFNKHVMEKKISIQLSKLQSENQTKIVKQKSQALIIQEEDPHLQSQSKSYPQEKVPDEFA